MNERPRPKRIFPRLDEFGLLRRKISMQGRMLKIHRDEQHKLLYTARQHAESAGYEENIII